MHLRNLVDTVVEHWPFDEESYPAMRGLTTEERRRFALRHVLFHQVKAVAKLTETMERHDHGAPLDEVKLQQAIRNFLINTLRLAAVAGIKPNRLTADIQGWASEKHAP